MNSEENVSQAQVKRLKSISIIWLVPIIAALIGGWMIYFHLSNQGAMISISFKTGEGIEAGKTKIKIKNVEVGQVINIELSDDLGNVAVSARIHQHNEHLLKKDTHFWVVRPRVGKGGISGLGTLLSGAYIELSPGKSTEEHDEFIGLENEPVTPGGTPGIHVTLEGGDDSLSLQVGDQILFHGMDVGRIEHVHFNTAERAVYYNAFIQSPYDKLITTNTKFWDISGVKIDSSADGISVHSGTLESIISGGVTFDVPKDLPRGELVTEREFFTIFPNKNAVNENRYKHALHYILLFKDSIRGLKPGAPVEYRGIKIGTVIRTDVKYPEITNVLDQETLMPVMISVEPGRMGFEDNKVVLPEAEQRIAALLEKGLKGGLVTGNLLTGSKYIELQYEKNRISNGTNKLATFSGHAVIPTRESPLEQFISKADKLMDKLHNLPIEPILNDTGTVLKQVSETLIEFQKMTKQLEIFLKQSTDQNLVGSVQSALVNFKQLMADFSEGSLTHEELQSTLRVMQDALAGLEPLLLKFNQEEKDIEPKGISQ